MQLVQLLLPVTSTPRSQQTLRDVRTVLTERFGGVTAYTRAPAHGVWVDETDAEVHDDVIIVEVMVEQLDRTWWTDFRKELERKLDQELIVIRASSIDVL
jgi:hypothetical protein